MASYYVYSGAAGAANGTSWADAYTTVASAISGKAAGDVFYIAHDHNEATAGGVTIDQPARAQFLCVNRAGSVPPVAADLTTGALIKTTGANNILLGWEGQYFYGLSFYSTSDEGASSGNIRFDCRWASAERCHFRLGGTSEAQIHAAGVTTWKNCTVQFGADSQSVRPGGTRFWWHDTASAISGAIFPTDLIEPSNFGAGVLLEGLDLSAIPSGKNLATVWITNNQMVLKDCKLASGVTVMTALNYFPSAGIDLIRCDDGATNYRHERYHGVGTQTTETTIVRTGGASDGVTPVAWKIVTAATASQLSPFESMPITVWNDTSGSAKTITVEGIWGGGAVPDNNDIWIEVEYLGDASSPQGSFVSSGVATILTTASSYASSSETWGGSTTKFAMSATTGTIQQKGPITVRIFAALPSSTFYVCPKVTVA
jgi:hypothetical protein